MSEEKPDEQVANVPINDVPQLKDIVKALPERMRELQLTPKEVEVIKDALGSQQYFGEHASLPMDCLGPKCPMRSICPLLKIGKVPLGNPCPIEATLMATWQKEYGDALQVDWNDKVERQATMDLVECDVLQARANGILSTDGFVMENAIGVSPSSGEAIIKKEMHIAMGVKDIIHKRKERLLKSLVMTRETKRKLGVLGSDPAKKEAELLERARKAREAIRVKDAEIVNHS